MDIIMLMAVRLGCRVVIPILWIRKSLLDSSSPFVLAGFAYNYPRGLLDDTNDDDDDDEDYDDDGNGVNGVMCMAVSLGEVKEGKKLARLGDTLCSSMWEGTTCILAWSWMDGACWSVLLLKKTKLKASHETGGPWP